MIEWMKSTPLNAQPVRYLWIALLSGVGMFLVWYSTRWGAGLISDTFQYIASARNFVAGNGFSIPYGDGQLEPMTKYAPMFSVVLAMFEFAGISALQGARFVNVFLFGVNIFLVFICVHKLTRSYYFSLLASLLFSFSLVLIEVHSWALSEPLYICLGLCAFLALEKCFKETKRTWLIVASLMAACAFLTRYVGLSLVVAVITVIFLGSLGIRRKLVDALLFGSIAVLPTAIWTLRGYLITATLNDRIIEFHPLTKKNYASAIDVIFQWFLPPPLVQGNEKLLLILSGVLLLGVAVYLLRFYRVRLAAPVHSLVPNNEIIALHVVYVFTYVVMIIVSKTWVDPDIGLSDRILSPMLVSLLILVVALLSFLWDNFARTRIVIALISLGLLAYYLTGTIIGIQILHQGGIGIARGGWNRSDVVQALRTYSSFSIYTNSNSSLYLWSDRSGYDLKDFRSLKENGTDKKVLLVIFHHLPPSGESLNRLIEGLHLIEEDRFVSIYGFGPVQ